MPRAVSILGPVLVSLLIAAACASRDRIDPVDPGERLQQRTGAATRVTGLVAPEVPSAVQLDDGLTPDEAVALALWNNAAFQVSVSTLGFARADLARDSRFEAPKSGWRPFS